MLTKFIIKQYYSLTEDVLKNANLIVSFNIYSFIKKKIIQLANQLDRKHKQLCIYWTIIYDEKNFKSINTRMISEIYVLNNSLTDNIM